jgi:hypothetical protein
MASGKGMSRTTLPMTQVIYLLSAIDHLDHLPLQGDYCQQDVHPTNDCNKHPDQTEEVPHEEQKKKWYDLDDQRKKQLEVQIFSLAS